jgi:hypothetical protein
VPVKSGSYYGTFDQAGNVEEWTEEIVYITNRRLRGVLGVNEFYSNTTDFANSTLPITKPMASAFASAATAE